MVEFFVLKQFFLLCVIINSIDNEMKFVVSKVLDDIKFQDMLYLVDRDSLEGFIMLYVSMYIYQFDSLIVYFLFFLLVQ